MHHYEHTAVFTLDLTMLGSRLFYSIGHVKLHYRGLMHQSESVTLLCVSFHGPTDPAGPLDHTILSGNAISQAGMHTHAHTFHIWNNTVSDFLTLVCVREGGVVLARGLGWRSPGLLSS